MYKSGQANIWRKPSPSQSICKPLFSAPRTSPIATRIPTYDTAVSKTPTTQLSRRLRQDVQDVHALSLLLPVQGQEDRRGSPAVSTGPTEPATLAAAAKHAVRSQPARLPARAATTASVPKWTAWVLALRAILNEVSKTMCTRNEVCGSSPRIAERLFGADLWVL